jgi:hypothetical protein
MTYEEKKAIADNYIDEKCGLSWDDLPDMNSLHDAETVKDIHEMCRERLEESGYYSDLWDEDEQ